MKQIDLDDLPPRVAALLSGLETSEPVLLVRGGLVVGRLSAQSTAAKVGADAPDAAPPEETLKEVMEQFNAMIHDEF